MIHWEGHMVHNLFGRGQKRKPNKKQQALRDLIQLAEAGEALLRSARLAVVITMPLFGVGAFAGGVLIGGAANLELPVLLEIICKNEAGLLDSNKSVSDVADEMLERMNSKSKDGKEEVLNTELLETRQFYYHLVQQCRKMK